eukprot:GGOE01041772.1.p2 GENE.GGOE01041772.1~~GGOE01041772.1.p2  ORF type:complete len:114 (-),score=23.61 GGOE01041772.1:218-559(-)
MLIWLSLTWALTAGTASFQSSVTSLLTCGSMFTAELLQHCALEAPCCLRPTPKQLDLKTGGPPTESMLMTLEGLRMELSGLEFLLGDEKVRDVVEGKYHTGPGAVVQVIARKP